MDNLLSIYIHIPFCVRKCNYCDFLSYAATDPEKEEYVRALTEEIRDFAEAHGKEYRVKSIFFGGGTPSLLPLKLMGEILDLLHKSFTLTEDCEITLECNPGTVDRSRLAFYYMNGINRLSFGLQSTDDAELARLGRIHTYKDFLAGYSDALRVGFTNINIDLMSALPGQTLESYRKTLRNVLMLKPVHISSYSLIIEEGTPFGDAVARGENLDLPEEDAEREMYEETRTRLQAAGLSRYEISNYAREGYACRHNLTYWERGEYVGFGLGASSLLRCEDFPPTEGFRDTRIKNHSRLADYERRVSENRGLWSHFAEENFEEVNRLSLKDCMEEFMFLGLRKMSGVSADDFRLQFGRQLDHIYAEPIRKYTDLGYLTYRNNILQLTERGIHISNVILSDFLLD